MKLADYLGDMTDELIKDYGVNAKIIEFVSTGAKSYSYKIEKEDGTFHYIVKVKGFSLNHATQEMISMEKMIEFVKDKCDNGTSDKKAVITSNEIRRRKDHQLVTQTVKKTFQVTADKRKLLCGTYETRPFGYQ